MNEFWKNPDLLVRTGSHLYGCSTPTSDVDTRGFVVEPHTHMTGEENFEQHETKDPDHVVWGFKKFMKLLKGFSPNTVEILFAPKEHILQVSPQGQMLIDNRHLFIAKRLVKPTQGFALSEWKKAIDPDFQKKDDMGENRLNDLKENGYCRKNAYHAIRLLEECVEFLETGTITFPRPNADFLKAIRHANVHVDDVKARWKALDESIPSVLAKSTIPEDIDKTAIRKLFNSVIKDKMIEFMRVEYDLVCTSAVDHYNTHNFTPPSNLGYRYDEREEGWLDYDNNVWVIKHDSTGRRFLGLK